MTLKTIVISEGEDYREYISECLVPFKYIIVVGLFSTVQEAVKYINEKNVDIVFLQEKNRNQYLELKNANLFDGTTIVLITNEYISYASDDISSECKLISEIFTTNQFVELISGIYLEVNRRLYGELILLRTTFHQKNLFVKTGTKTYKIAFQNLLYFQKQGNYFIIHCRDSNKILSRMSFAELLNKLPTGEFMRVHQSYLINLRHIEVLENNCVIIAQHRIPVSNKYKHDLLQLISL
jgi:two-component system, LytTR family, response regulator